MNDTGREIYADDRARQTEPSKEYQFGLCKGLLQVICMDNMIKSLKSYGLPAMNQFIIRFIQTLTFVIKKNEYECC